RCSSSSSAGSISEADESQSPRPQLFLPPISGLVKDITYDHQSEPSLLKEPRNWYPPCQTSLPSSLRETLPAKRSKTEHSYYASPDVVERFRGVVDALATEAEVTASTAVSASQAPEISEDLLATLTHNIQIAQENAYGRDGSSQGVKLPASLFVVPDHG
ncbi:hypothetical protein EV181_007461, partial [Coemansia sp. RSA 532]